MILQTATADSATVGQDYEHYSRVVRFAPYETEKTIHIDIMDDRKREAPEVFYTRLSLQIADVRLSDDDRQTAIWIGDDDHQKAIQSTTADYGDDLRKRHFQVAEGDTDSITSGSPAGPPSPSPSGSTPTPATRTSPSRRTPPIHSMPATGSNPTSSPSGPDRTTTALTDTCT